MKSLTITEVSPGKFVLTQDDSDIVYLKPENVVGVCSTLGHSYEYPTDPDRLPGAVYAFFQKPPADLDKQA